MPAQEVSTYVVVCSAKHLNNTQEYTDAKSMMLVIKLKFKSWLPDKRRCVNLIDFLYTRSHTIIELGGRLLLPLPADDGETIQVLDRRVQAQYKNFDLNNYPSI